MKSEQARLLENVRNEVLEEAARVCDKDAKFSQHAFIDSHINNEPREKQIALAASIVTAEECAKGIRALKKVIIAATILLLATACGPTFSENLFGGDQDAAAMVRPDVEASKDGSDGSSDSPTSLGDSSTPDAATVGDAAAVYQSDADAGSDVEVDACSCADLCSGAYPLRSCEICFKETCPTWEGGFPQ